jgi:hypothetical protein
MSDAELFASAHRKLIMTLRGQSPIARHPLTESALERVEN